MKWKLRRPFPEINQVDNLMKDLGVSHEISYLLVQRGIKDYNSAKFFFRPLKEDLHSPFLMLGMDKAIERIEKAVDKQEKVMVFGDYDVDGITAVTLVYSYFKNYLPSIFYVPDRYSEGYGVSKKGIDLAIDQKVNLIISLDCGINSMELISYAKTKGIDFIICDHHIPGEKLPEAIAILNPKQDGCSYPYKDLCGCGIGFKLVHAFDSKRGGGIDNLSNFFDLVGMAIAADLVPLRGENRILAFYGLKQINETPRQGIQIFLKEINREITISDLVFVLAPRINAAGRIKHAKHAIELLLSKDKSKTLSKGRLIEMLNTERRSLDQEITLQALNQIKENGEENTYTSVVFQKDWSKGVIGIVASRIIETYYRPTVVLTSSGEYFTGSARSVKGIDIYEILLSCKNHIVQFGGHKYAAGLKIKPEAFNQFKKAFEKAVKEKILPEQRIPIFDYDVKLSFDKITPKFYRILSQMRPFGTGNYQPIFMTENCFDSGKTKIVGKSNEHLKLDLIDDSGKRFTGIGFGMAEYLKKIKTRKPFKIFYNVDRNQYLGVKNFQLKIRDIEF